METKKIAVVMAVEDVERLEGESRSRAMTFSDLVRDRLGCRIVKNGGPREGGGRPKKAE